MSPPPSSAPSDLPLDQLLREFLRDYRREREELREERKEVRRQLREQNVEIQKTQTETLRLVGLVNVLEQKVSADINSFERELGGVKARVDDLDAGVDGVVEKTGQHEITKLHEELASMERTAAAERARHERIAEEQAKAKREWVRSVVLAAITFIAGLGIAWFGATVKGCLPQASASPAKAVDTAVTNATSGAK